MRRIDDWSDEGSRDRSELYHAAADDDGKKWSGHPSIQALIARRITNKRNLG